jgi:phosphohistidine phosphatase
MKLHLLRHAKTNQISPTGKDFDRELLPRGYEQIAELKRYLQNHPIAPKHILCSTAMRTRQTLVELQALWPAASVQYIDELYLASKQTILDFICALKSPDDILVIGHNEGLSELTIYLSDQAVWHKTCGLVSLEFPFESSALVSKETGVIVGSFRVG